MNASTPSETNEPRARPRAETIEELLDREEARALHDVTESIQRLGDDLCTATDLRARVRAHPFWSTGIAFAAGFVLVPVIARGLGRALPMAAAFVGARKAATGGSRSSARPGEGLPALVRSALGFVRPRG